MTKEEFEKGYAERSGVTLEWLHEKGQIAMPCDCDYEGCQGWQMVSRELYEEYLSRDLPWYDRAGHVVMD